MADFFDQLSEFRNLEGASDPDPLESVRPSLKWLKDTLADESKSRYVEDDLFNPENTHLSTDEYRAKVVREKEQAKIDRENADKNKLIQDGATKLNADAMLAQINAVRQAQGQLPLLPEKADLKNPNNAQAIIAALGAFMFPEHSFDIAAAPLQYQLGEQAKEQARLDQGHAEQIRRAGVDANLSLAAGEAEQRANEMNFQADVNRQTRKDEQAFQKEVIGINFGNALTMESSGFARQLELLDKNQQHQLGMFFIGNAIDPNVGPEVRAAANAKLKSMGIEIAPVQGSSAATGIASGLGIDPKQLAGMTLPELQHFVGMSLALKDEKRKAELFPEQLQQMKDQGSILGKELKFKDQMLQMQYDLGQMSILNTQSEMDNRTWMQSYNTDEQQRLRIGQIGTMYQGSLDALSMEYASNSKAISDNMKILADAGADKADQKKAREDNVALEGRNTDLRKVIDGLSTQYLKLADDIRSQTGLDVQGTNNGESFLGTPYSWGGGSTTGPSKGVGKGAQTTGFDCSGFTRAVANLDYGVNIPRTAKEQWGAGTGLFTITTSLDKGDPIEGDFLYFREGENWHTGVLVYHVEDGAMVAYIRHAPKTGEVVRDDRLEDFIKTTSKKFLGIRRVAKRGVTPPR